MAPGITLAVIGAILTFAVRAQPSFIDLRVLGVILMIAGAVLIWLARRGSLNERASTRTREQSGPEGATSPVRGRRTRDTIRGQDVE
jgi:membrane protein implicated in regulation of membrane protease activity